MSKKIKNILLIVVMVISVVGVIGTIYYAKNNVSETADNTTLNDGMPNGEIRGNKDLSDDATIDGRFGGKGNKGTISSDELPDLDSFDGELPIKDLPDGDISDDIPSGDLPSKGNQKGDMADGGFAGAGTTTIATSTQLNTIHIVIIGAWCLIFSVCLIYLLMSNFSNKKVFSDGNKITIFILSSIIATGVLTTGITILANKVILSNGSSNNNVEYSSPDDLHVDMANWSYDSSNNVYYQIGLVYVANPATVEYESLGIYIPGDYMDCSKNSNDKYTCEANTTNKVGNYTSETAPIVMPINTAGYSAQAAPTSYSYNGLSDYLDAGFIYVYAGCRGRNNGDSYDGGAPWGVTDLKSAIRYIRYNDASLPGDTDSLFVFGHSGGGAQSTLVGATGDSDLYTPYLESIGALMTDDEGNTLSDAIAGVMAWCPITSLDYANEAYEWNMGQYSNSGTRASSTWTSALSLDLAESFAKYINALKLVDEKGKVLTLSSTSDGIYVSGSYYDYLLGVIEESLTNYLNDNYASVSDMQSYVASLNSDETWVTFNKSSKSVSISSIEAFVNHCKSASKNVGAFDDLDRSQAENAVFGNSETDALHFDKTMYNLLKNNASKYAKYDDYDSKYISEYETDLKNTDSLGNDTYYRQNMYNPMYYLTDYYDGYETSTVAKYWRIHTGITQGDTALTVETNLALALKNYSSVKSVEFATVWNQGHTTAERTGDSTTNFIAWINECLS